MEILDGKYQIEQLLGQGGMGAVYRATHLGTKRTVVFITPLTAIMISLLYVKTRKAVGESLKDASSSFEARDVARSKWQTKMRTRRGRDTYAEDQVTRTR